MSRPPKEGLEYFPLDVGVFEDDKLFDIQNKYGCLGEVIYLRLLCLIYKNGYYYEFSSLDKLAAMMIKSIGNKWVGNKQTVKQVIRALVEVDLFAKSLFPSNVITSEGIQRRYLKACERRQSMNKRKYWLLDKDKPIGFTVSKNPINVCNNPINVCNNSVNVDNNAQKVKESKVKERVITNARAYIGFQDFIEVCKEYGGVFYQRHLQDKRGTADYFLSQIWDEIQHSMTLEDVKKFLITATQTYYAKPKYCDCGLLRIFQNPNCIFDAASKVDFPQAPYGALPDVSIEVKNAEIAKFEAQEEASARALAYEQALCDPEFLAIETEIRCLEFDCAKNITGAQDRLQIVYKSRADALKRLGMSELIGNVEVG